MADAPALWTLADREPTDIAMSDIRRTLTWADLERETGSIRRVPAVFAYPSGAAGSSAVEAARQACLAGLPSQRSGPPGGPGTVIGPLDALDVRT